MAVYHSRYIDKHHYPQCDTIFRCITLCESCYCKSTKTYVKYCSDIMPCEWLVNCVLILRMWIVLTSVWTFVIMDLLENDRRRSDICWYFPAGGILCFNTVMLKPCRSSGVPLQSHSPQPYHHGTYVSSLYWQNIRDVTVHFYFYAVDWAAWRASGLQKLSGGCWLGYLFGTRYRFAYGPHGATATNCILLQ